MLSAQCIGAVNTIAGNNLVAEELLTGNILAGNLAYGSLGAPYRQGFGYAANTIAPTTGGGFAVTSYSPIAPSGITVISDNAIEGALAVNGMMPFLGAIALEGALPTAGAGGINYGCGSGAVAIVSEGVANAGLYGPVANGPAYPATGYGLAGVGYGPALGNGLGFGRPGLGLGCGAF
uniref:Uncharacterized protein n=1 Tax=Heliothis virescens TaxID=7102 RepID=A0A2A4JZQ6_HELVI